MQINPNLESGVQNIFDFIGFDSIFECKCGWLLVIEEGGGKDMRGVAGQSKHVTLSSIKLIERWWMMIKVVSTDSDSTLICVVSFLTTRSKSFSLIQNNTHHLFFLWVGNISPQLNSQNVHSAPNNSQFMVKKKGSFRFP